MLFFYLAQHINFNGHQISQSQCAFTKPSHDVFGSKHSGNINISVYLYCSSHF